MRKNLRRIKSREIEEPDEDSLKKLKIECIDNNTKRKDNNTKISTRYLHYRRD